MSTILRRGTLPAVAVLLALALALAALASRPRPAGAQTVTGDIVLGVSTVVDPDANGYVVLGGGTADGIVAVDCSGSNPQGGTSQIPAQVMCQLRNSTILVRVKNHVGANVTGLVRLNFFLDFGEEVVPLTAQTTARHLHQVG